MAKQTIPLIDADVHHAWRSDEDLIERLREPYKSEVAQYGQRQLKSGIRFEEGGMRWDTKPPGGGGAGSDPDHMKEQLLDRYGIRCAFLSGQTGPIAGIPDPDYAAAMCAAFNNLTVEKWLPHDVRFVSGIHVPLQDPQLAVREIERLAGHPQMVAVQFFATANRIPFGQRYYWPIYEACERVGLPIHVHPSTTAVIANAASGPAGMVTTYLESHTILPTFYMAQVASLIFEGVFEKFPQLKIGLMEGGFTWAPHLLWRMDKEFKGLRQQAPYLKRLPSAYVREHVRFGTQPIEEPDKAEHLVQIMDMLGEDALMWTSDYPHWDFDEPTAIPHCLNETARRKILHDNAAMFFNLPLAVEVN